MHYLHELPFPEVLASLAAKLPINDLQGRLIDPKTPPNTIFTLWQKQIHDIASGNVKHLGWQIRPEVTAYYLQTQSLTKAPVGATPGIEEAVIVEPKAFTPPRFTWSLTSLQDFENCPLCFAEKRYYKRVKDAPFDAQDWGNLVHKGLEKYLLRTPENVELIKPYLKYADAMLAASQGGTLYVEHDLAFTEQFKPCKPTDWDTVWYRGKSDVTIYKEGTVKVYDWKTGKVKNDDTQLKLMCACEAILHPEAQRFEGRYIWLKEDKVSTPVILDRSEIKGVWLEILARVKRMKQAWDAECWSAKVGGLCRAHC